MCRVCADVQARSTLCLSPKSNEATTILSLSYECPAKPQISLFIYKAFTAHSLLAQYPCCILASSQESLILLHVNNKGADQPVHPRRLICSFVFHFLVGRVDELATCT